MVKILKQKRIVCSYCVWTPFLFCCFKSSRPYGDVSQDFACIRTITILCNRICLSSQNLYQLDSKGSLLPLMNWYKCSQITSLFVVLHLFTFLISASLNFSCCVLIFSWYGSWRGCSQSFWWGELFPEWGLSQSRACIGTKGPTSCSVTQFNIFSS